MSDRGVRWGVMRDDLRAFGRRALEALRTDRTAWLLVAANVVPIIELVRADDPVVSILVIYWLQMMIIGFWSCCKLAVVSRWMAVLQIPMFLVMYLSVVNIFGAIATGLLHDATRGTVRVDDLSTSAVWWPALMFFVHHGVSFFVNFVADAGGRDVNWEALLGRPILRAVPMWLAALAGVVVGAVFGHVALVLLAVVPVKLALDLLGHFVEYDVLSSDGA